MTSISSENLEGIQIENYQILEKIGSGGMGVVYLAHEKSLQRNVCIKVLRDKYKDDPIVSERFQKEAINIAKLDDNHIINIYKISSYMGIKFFVMEYVDGTSLDKYLYKKGKLYWKEVLKIVSEILEALVIAHSSNIIHRDIKPANILINSKNVIKVTDFGLARYVKGDLGITDPGTVLGTPCYMSPEQWLGEKATSACDLYSLGITMYELLTGEIPYNVNNYSELLKESTLHNASKKLREKRSDIPEEVHSLLENLLNPDPRSRYSSKSTYDLVISILKNYGNINDTKIVSINKNIKKPSEQSTILSSNKKDSLIVTYIKNETKTFKKILLILGTLSVIIIIAYIVLSLL